MHAIPEFGILVRAALETGARYEELARLRVVDFNPDSGTLHVRKSKAHKDRHIVLTDDGREFFASLVAGRKGSELGIDLGLSFLRRGAAAGA